MVLAAVFASVTFGSLVVFQVVTRLWHPDSTRSRRRLIDEFDTRKGGDASPLYGDLSSLEFGPDDEGDRADGEAYEPIEVSAPKASPRERIDVFIRQAALKLTVPQFVGLVVGCGASAAVPGALFGGLVGGVFGFAAGTVTVVVAVDTRRRARRERYLKQLAGALELMARVLKTGQSVSEAFRAVVDSFEDPVAGEFATCLHQIELGIRPEVAYRDLGREASILEIRIFIMALAIQRQTGGNLSELVDRLATLVRARVRTRQKIRSLTAEGRLQSLTLIVLPILTFMAMYFLNRQYASMLIAQGRLLLATGFLMAVGIIWIRRIVNFEG